MTGNSRKAAVVRILLGLFLIVLALVVVLQSPRFSGFLKILIAVVCILSAVFGYLFYFQGCFHLVRAKGYGDGPVLAGVVVGALFCPGLLFLLPLFVAFFLEDRNRSYSRKRRRR